MSRKIGFFVWYHGKLARFLVMSNYPETSVPNSRLFLNPAGGPLDAHAAPPCIYGSGGSVGSCGLPDQAASYGQPTRRTPDPYPGQYGQTPGREFPMRFGSKESHRTSVVSEQRPVGNNNRNLDVKPSGMLFGTGPVNPFRDVNGSDPRCTTSSTWIQPKTVENKRVTCH